MKNNIFYGHKIPKLLRASTHHSNGVVFMYHVTDPVFYGVVEYDKNLDVNSIEEKSIEPKSNYAVTGIYFYYNSVVSIAENLKQSARGGFEITNVNHVYQRQNLLKAEACAGSVVCLDTRNLESLMQASQFIQVIEQLQCLQVCSIEEIAYLMNFIDRQGLKREAFNFFISNTIN